jgi:hypothetical protein
VNRPLAENNSSRSGNVAPVLVWAMSMILMSVAMALRRSGRLTIDQFTIMTSVVIVISAFGLYLRWRLYKIEVEAWRRWLCALMVVAAVGIGGYTAILDATAENRVRPVCSALTPGMSVQAVTAIAEAHGMFTPRDGATVYYIGEKATGNSFGCLLRFKERILERSTYSPGGRE